MAPRTARPCNIVFVHVDQMGHEAVGAYGRRQVQTPNMDRLVKEGTAFMLSHWANPVCCPARASWYTGRASSEHGVVQNRKPLKSDMPDLGQWMGARGDG